MDGIGYEQNPMAGVSDSVFDPSGLLHNNSHVINNFTANIDPCLMCVVNRPRSSNK